MAKSTSVSRKSRVDPVGVSLERLADAQEETQAELRALAGEVRDLAGQIRELARQVLSLAGSVQHFGGRVGNIEGQLFEDRYQKDPFSHFQTVLRRMRVVPKQELDALASDFIEQGKLADREREDVLRADVIVYGRPKDAAGDTYLVAEVSATSQPHDVARAIRRAELVSRLTGEEALPAVAGRAIDPDAATVGRNIWRILDGVAVAPGQPIPESLTERRNGV